MNDSLDPRHAIFREDALSRHMIRVVEPTVEDLDPPRWLPLLWLLAIALGGLAAAILR